MAHVVKTKNNKKIVLLNPSEKGKRYSRQLKDGAVRETGEVLSATDKAYRAGYLTARSDNAKAYNSNMGIKSKAKARGKSKPMASGSTKKTYVAQNKDGTFRKKVTMSSRNGRKATASRFSKTRKSR